MASSFYSIIKVTLVIPPIGFFMETKDFNPDFINAKIISILSYDTVMLEIDYPESKEIKECKLFRITKLNTHLSYYTDVLNHLTNLANENNHIKIKVLKERRQSRKSMSDIIMMFTLDEKTNINDRLLKYIREDENLSKIKVIINKLRSKKN